MRRGSSLIAAIIALAAGLAGAPAAPAASVVFASEGDLIASTPDGTLQRLIADGTPARGFSSPSVAPDGSVWTIYDGRLVHLSASGATLGVLVHGAPSPPVDAVVSPDGTRLAYVAADAANVRTTWYARTDGTGGEAEFGPQVGLGGPAWLDNDRVLLDRGPDAVADNVLVDVVTPAGGPTTSWFADAAERPADGAVNVGLTFGAWIAQGGATIDLFALTGPPPAVPVSPCSFRGPGAADPAWSPDGSALAWHDADGVWVSAIPSLADCTALRAKRIGPDHASAPHWSPLDVQPGLPALATDARPRVARPSLLPRAFPAATGTTVQFTATAAGTATMAIVQLTPGVRRARGCVAGRPRKKLQGCRLRTPVGASTQAPIVAGPVALPLLRPELVAGAYELWIVVADAIGRSSAPKRLAFVVR